MNKRIALILSAMLIMSGCSTIKTNELTLVEAEQLNTKSLTYTKYNELPDFAAQTAVNVQFGMLGVASAVSSGNAMMIRNNIRDPAFKIAQALAKKIGSKHNVKVVKNKQEIPLSSSIPSIVSQHPGHDYILDVKTTNWGSIYFMNDWDNYKINYFAHARLIDTSTKAVVAEVLCSSKPEVADTNLAPSYEALESGVGIRSELAKSIEYCVDYIIAEANINGDKKMPEAVAKSDF